MKKLLVVISLLINVSCLYAITAEELLDKMDKIRNYETAQMEASMIIIDKKGRETKMSLVSYEKKEGDKSLMRFTGPARLKGTSILTVGDNIWYYNNRTNRVRLLSKSAKKGSMMGSSFSYEDISTDYRKDYTASIESENDNKYIIKMVPKQGGKNYKYLLAEVRKDNYVASKVEYYNDNSLKYKEMISEDIKDIDGHIFPLVIKMTEIGSQKVTIFSTDEKSAKFDVELKNKLFSERYLKR